MSNYSKGRVYEWKAQKELEAEGYVVVRSSASHSPIDLIAVGCGSIKIIQVKSTKGDKVYMNTYKEDISSLREMKVPDNVTREIWVWRRYKGWTKELIT